ncbi:MAG: HU family DNA-binding protein [Muribaculaceae bacterium]|nr:HU family DNA-binding protein [Muribaculaceae bacterium]
MNEKITLPTLVQLLAIASGDTKKQSEDFIKEFFSIISQALSEGEQVKIKDFGVFKTILVDERESVNVSTGEHHIIPAHRKVVFVPAKEIAALVNSPFDMFEAVEIDADITVDGEDTGVKFIPVYDEIPPKNLGKSFDSDQLPYSAEPTEGQTDESEQPRTEDQMAEFLQADENGSADAEVVDHAMEDSLYQEKITELPEDSEGIDNNQMVISNVDTESKADSESKVDSDYEPETSVEVEESLEDASVQDISDIEEELPEKPKKRFCVGFLCGFVAAAILCGLLFVGVFYYGFIHIPGVSLLSNSDSSSNQKNAAQVEALPTDSNSISESTVIDNKDSIPEVARNIEQSEKKVTEGENGNNQIVPTEPSDKRIFDTISHTRYLTTMAKQHYGNYHLWPYIYIENQDFLGHPDRIRPGTKVVIPPLSKYGVNPSNPADIEKAKKKGIEIYSRYKN